MIIMLSEGAVYIEDQWLIHEAALAWMLPPQYEGGSLCHQNSVGMA